MQAKHYARLLALLLAAGSLVLLIRTPMSAAQDAAVFVPGQVVVKLNPVGGVSIAAINTAYGTTVVAELAPLLRIYLVQAPAGVDTEQLIDQMAGDPRLLYAEPNYISDTPEGRPRSIGAWGGTAPGPYTGQNAVTLLGLAAAQQISRGAGTVVAVIDTGVQLDHPALANSWTAARYNFVEGTANPSDIGDGQDDDADGSVDEMLGHGTHVAGIVHLVAPEARIMPLRVLDSDGKGAFFAVAEAIDYAVDHGADVINLSLGTSAKSELIADAVRWATSHGVVVVAAAGNLNSDEEQYPAAAQCALAVTSTDLNDLKSSFGNFGGWVGLAAPGETIYSAFPPGGYARWSGTSMAAPFVAGQAALIRAEAPAANPRQIAALVGATARPLDQLNPEYDGKLGQGRITIGASLAYLIANGLPPEGGGIMSGSCVEGVEGSLQRLFLPILRR